MHRTSPSVSRVSRISLTFITRVRVARLAFAFLLVPGAVVAIGSAPVAEAQNFGPNFADACFGQSLVVIQGVHPDTSGQKMVLTDGGLDETSAIYCPISTEFGDGSFATTFTFQITDPAADGFTFAVVNGDEPPNGLLSIPPPHLVGGAGGGLGYYGLTSDTCDPTGGGGNGCSVALKFDLHNNEGEGPNSTGLYTYGANPTVPAINLSGTGIDLHSGHPINALVKFNGARSNLTLTLTLTDTVTKAKWSHPFNVDIENIVGDFPSAFSFYNYGLGFTAATGGESSTQEILNWNTAVYYPSYTAIGYYDFAYGGDESADIQTNPALFHITQDLQNSAGSVFYAKPLDVRKFATGFSFKLADGGADGFTFVIGGLSTVSSNQFGQPAGAVGSVGGGLGYAGIPKSVAVKFDLFNNQGEGANSTGLYVNGAEPTVPAIDLDGTGINLHSNDLLHAYITYDGTTLNLNITDMVTGASFTHAFPIDIPGTIGSPTGYVGFTGGTGEDTSTIQILNWTYWGGLTESPE